MTQIIISAETGNQYPSALDISKKLIENSIQIQKENEELVKLYLARLQYDSGIWSSPERMVAMTKEYVSEDFDLDDFVYETISEWDDKFKGDTDWCNEDFDNNEDDEYDLKDQLRDFLMNIFEKEGVGKTVSEINEEFFKKDSVLKEMQYWG